jgi:hypothetical protein
LGSTKSDFIPRYTVNMSLAQNPDDSAAILKGFDRPMGVWVGEQDEVFDATKLRSYAEQAGNLGRTPSGSSRRTTTSASSPTERATSARGSTRKQATSRRTDELYRRVVAASDAATTADHCVGSSGIANVPNGAAIASTSV